MGKYIFLKKLGFVIFFCCATNYAIAKNDDQSADALKMQDFHLLQAEEKLAKQDLAHAWGDLAYIVCRVPNHHVALQHMLDLAPKLGKQLELSKYLEKALKLFPEDARLKAMYSKLSS